jgi:hypothetical protein
MAYNNERNFQEALERSRKEEEAAALQRVINQSTREALEADAREEAAQLQRAASLSKREAEEAEAAQLQRVINQSTREAEAAQVRKVLEETGTEYKQDALQIALQFLDGNTNQLRRDAIVHQMETDAIFDVSRYKSSNTNAIREVKNLLKKIQDKLTNITSGEEDLDEKNKDFIISLPFFLKKHIYAPLGLNRKDILEKNETYQIVKATRDKMDAANAVERDRLAKEKNSMKRNENLETTQAAKKAAEEKIQEVKSTMNSNKARWNKASTNPRLKEAYEKSVVAYEKALEEFKRAYPPKGGRSTRKHKQTKKAKKTRSHR